jgi:putative peptide zinc metalloprotease protein
MSPDAGVLPPEARAMSPDAAPPRAAAAPPRPPAAEDAAPPAIPPAAPPQLLPPLREDIRLMPGPPQRDGAPSWTLYDPALHRYLRVGRLEFEILCHWGLRRPEAIAAAVAANTTFAASPADVLEVLRFADRASLLLPTGPQATRRLAGQMAAHRLSAAQWLLKNYLFLRVRLVDPDRFLAAALPLLRWIYSGRCLAVLGACAALGFFLIGQQWDSYTHSFLHLFSLQGAAEIGVALACAKAVHELGHGLTAKRFGCRVPGMGVALLVLWPMLWTDCTDAWRLVDRRQRLLIDAAGMLAEIVLAVAASLLWSVLPDGPARSAAFLLSGSTWLITIAVNVNPLMRFDGYYLFGDWLGEPNLQERAFALARWRLRELLFGLRDAPPETLPAGRARTLTIYAVACWIYRFTLFTGIALLVYHLTFKLLGVFLMSVELGWFIARPILAELCVWRRRVPTAGRTWRTAVTALAALALVAVLATPWGGSVGAPALLRAARQTPLFTAEGGRLVSVTGNAATVAAGQPLFVLESPDVVHQLAAASAELAGLRARLAGLAFDPEAADDLPVAVGELAGAVARLRSADAQAALLTLHAPYAGTLVDVPRDLQPGVWLPRRERLGMLIDPASQAVEADVDEADVGRVHPGAAATFRPENGDPPVALVVRSVSPGAMATLDAPELASLQGGGVAVRQEKDGRLVPEAAVYRVMLDVVKQDVAMGDEAAAPGAHAPAVLRRGWVTIDGDRTSMLARLWRRAAAVVMREAGP